MTEDEADMQLQYTYAVVYTAIYTVTVLPI